MGKSKKCFTGRKKLVLLILIVVAVMLTVGFAWYLLGRKHTDTKQMEIMTPYALYLLNSGATDTLELNIGGIHPGESKEIVVCVSSHDANAGEDVISKEGLFPYTLELVHTDNIGLQYRMYSLEKLDFEPELEIEDIVASDYVEHIDGVDVVKTAYFQKEKLLNGNTAVTEEYRNEMYGEQQVASVVNQGTYCVYSEDSFELSLSDETKRYQYYMIEIEWDLNETEEKSKETDLMYLVAKAGVPKPLEITGEE